MVWTLDEAGDGTVTEAQREAATRAIGGLAGQPGVVGAPSPALVSDDKQAMQAVVPLKPDLEDGLSKVLDEIRETAQSVPGTRRRSRDRRRARPICRTRSPGSTDSCRAWRSPPCW
ncbi:hypothetical protein SHIRM173S_05936 [Streptomyces hirsutus]